MGTREVGLAGGIAAAAAAGAVRFADNCASSGARLAASSVDDGLRTGGRAMTIEGGALGDDAARAAALGGRVEPRIGIGGRGVPIELQGEHAAGALGHGSVESRVGKELLEQGAEQALESTSEILLDHSDDGRVDPELFDRATKARRAQLFEDVDTLAAMLTAQKPPVPLVILAGSADRGATVITRDAEIAVDSILRDCVAHGVRCVVVTCPPADEDCREEVWTAWSIATDAANRATVDDLLAGFYVELALREPRGLALRRVDRNVAGVPVAVTTRVR